MRALPVLPQQQLPQDPEGGGERVRGGKGGREERDISQG